MVISYICETQYRCYDFMLVYGVEPVLPVEIELLATYFVVVAQLDPFKNDYATKYITTLECLEEYRSETSKR